MDPNNAMSPKRIEKITKLNKDRATTGQEIERLRASAAAIEDAGAVAVHVSMTGEVVDPRRPGAVVYTSDRMKEAVLRDIRQRIAELEGTKEKISSRLLSIAYAIRDELTPPDED